MPSLFSVIKFVFAEDEARKSEAPKKAEGASQ